MRPQTVPYCRRNECQNKTCYYKSHLCSSARVLLRHISGQTDLSPSVTVRCFAFDWRKAQCHSHNVCVECAHMLHSKGFWQRSILHRRKKRGIIKAHFLTQSLDLPGAGSFLAGGVLSEQWDEHCRLWGNPHAQTSGCLQGKHLFRVFCFVSTCLVLGGLHWSQIWRYAGQGAAKSLLLSIGGDRHTTPCRQHRKHFCSLGGRVLQKGCPCYMQHWLHRLRFWCWLLLNLLQLFSSFLGTVFVIL